MAFRQHAAAIVRVGLAPGRQVIIDPSAPGEITFPNNQGLTPAEIGTTAGGGLEVLIIAGPSDPASPLDGPATMRFNAATTAPPSWSVGMSDASVGKSMALLLSPDGGLQAQLGSGAVGTDFFGTIPIILNTTNFGAAGLGSRWLMQVLFFNGVSMTAGADFQLAFPIQFPAGQMGLWGWPFIDGVGGIQNITSNGNSNSFCQFRAGATQTRNIGLIVFALYP